MRVFFGHFFLSNVLSLQSVFTWASSVKETGLLSFLTAFLRRAEEQNLYSCTL